MEKFCIFIIVDDGIIAKNTIKKEIPLESKKPRKKKMGVIVSSTERLVNGDNQEFWKEGKFAKMSENSLNNYKRYQM